MTGNSIAKNPSCRPVTDQVDTAIVGADSPIDIVIWLLGAGFARSQISAKSCQTGNSIDPQLAYGDISCHI